MGPMAGGLVAAVALACISTTLVEGAPGTMKVVTCSEGYAPMIMRSNDGSFYGFEVEQWGYIHRILKARVALTGDADLIQLVGDSPPPLIGIRGLSVPEAGISILMSNMADVIFCGYYITGPRARTLDPSPELLKSGYTMVAPASQSIPSDVSLLAMSFPNVGADGLFALLLLLSLSFVYAHVIWFIERGAGDMINEEYASGVFDAWYMSMAVATTAGFGDKVPLTFLGKIVTVVWIFTSLYCAGMFAATITTILVSSQMPSVLSSPIKVPSDLVGRKVGVYFNEARNVLLRVEPRVDRIMYYPDVNWAYNALANGDVDAVIDDLRIAQYQVALPQLLGRVIITGNKIMDVGYGFYVSRPNGTTHPIYPHLFRSVIDLTRGDWQVFQKYLEGKWMIDRSSTLLNVQTLALMNQALMNANFKLIGGLIAALVCASVATMYTLREEMFSDKERHIIVKLLGVQDKLDRYECRKAALKLFHLWDVSKDQSLSLHDLMEAFILEGIREEGLRTKLRLEASMSGAKVDSKGDFRIEVEEFQTMMMRLALEGFSSVDKHESSTLRGQQAHSQHVLMLLDEFRDIADGIEKKVDSITNMVDRQIGDNSEMASPPVLGRGIGWGDVMNERLLGAGSMGTCGVRVNVSDGNGPALVVVDAALESTEPSERSRLDSAQGAGTPLSPPSLRTPALESMLKLRSENIGTLSPAGPNILTAGIDELAGLASRGRGYV